MIFKVFEGLKYRIKGSSSLGSCNAVINKFTLQRALCIQGITKITL